MKPSRTSGRAWIVVVILVAAFSATLAFTDIGSGLFGEEAPPTAGRPVHRGPLRISVVERGNLKAADSVVLKSEVEGRTTILSLVPEGTWVEAGDLVCELDTAQLVEQRVSQEISVQNAEAAYVKAKQNYEIQLSENASDIARAERNKAFAELDLRKYIEGDYPQEKQRREEEILLADEELTRAKQDLEWSEKLAKEGFLESTQLDADRLAKNRAEITLNQKKRALELLEEFEHPRNVQEYEADVEEMGRELERVGLQADARLVDFEADRRTSKARYDLESEKLRKLDDQIEKAKMYAPVGGMVVYFQEEGGGMRRGGSGDPIQEGTEVRERQEIITIPSERGMIAEATLHESVLEKVDVGMPCFVTVDAVPDRTFAARVAFKALLPDQNSWWANPDLRVYRTTIELIDNDQRLRPGMSCSLEIVVNDLQDTLYVPLQSVFLDGGQAVCFVSGDSGVERREVEVGENDGKWAEIRAGLAENEVVLLSQPAGFSLRPAPAEEREGGMPGAGERDERPSADGSPAGGRSAGSGRPGGSARASGAREGGGAAGGEHGGGADQGGRAAERRGSEQAGAGRPGAGAAEKSSS